MDIEFCLSSVCIVFIVIQSTIIATVSECAGYSYANEPQIPLTRMLRLCLYLCLWACIFIGGIEIIQ